MLLIKLIFRIRTEEKGHGFNFQLYKRIQIYINCVPSPLQQTGVKDAFNLISIYCSEYTGLFSFFLSVNHPLMLLPLEPNSSDPNLLLVTSFIK